MLHDPLSGDDRQSRPTRVIEMGTHGPQEIRPLLVALATGKRAVMALPASRWKGIGVPAGSTGYQYADNGQTVGPCKWVILTLGHALKASCAGSGIGFTLNEPAQHALSVTLRTGALPQCLSFGGRIVNDMPTVGNHIGEFQATNSPAPASCGSSSP